MRHAPPHHFRLVAPVLILLIAMPVLADEPILTVDTGGHMGTIRDVMFTRDGKYLVSVSEDKTVRIWDVASGDIVRVLRGQIAPGIKGRIYTGALSSDASGLVIGGYMAESIYSDPLDIGKIRVIDLRNDRMTALLRGHFNVVSDIAFSPKGSRFISGGGGHHSARIWDPRPTANHHLEGHTKGVTTVAFSPDGNRVATGSKDKKIRLWDANSGSRIRTLRGHSHWVTSVVFTPDGRFLLSGGFDRTIRLWDALTGKFIKVLATHDVGVPCLSVSPDGSKVLTGSAGPDRGICSVYAVPTGRRLLSFTEHDSAVFASAISPDGRTAATGAGIATGIHLWEIDTGRVIHPLTGNGRTVRSVAFGRDGRHIAWGTAEQPELRDKMFGHGPLERAWQIRNESGGYDVTIADTIGETDGYVRALESAGQWSLTLKDGRSGATLHLLRNGRKKHSITLDNHSGRGHVSATLTPDGRYVITGAFDGFLTAYSTETGRAAHDFLGHVGHVWSVAVSPDSRHLVSGGQDQTVRLWRIPGHENTSETDWDMVDEMMALLGPSYKNLSRPNMLRHLKKKGMRWNRVSKVRPIFSCFHGTDEEWVIWTPDGYYTSSPNGDKYVGWHFNNGEDKLADYYSAFQFERLFYRPDYVNAYARFEGDREQAAEVLEGHHYDISNLRDVVPPDIEITHPSYGGHHTDRRLSLEFSAESSGLEMRDYSVFVNNIPVIPSSDRILIDQERRVFTRQVLFPPYAGKNDIRVEVFNGVSMGIAQTTVYSDSFTEQGRKGNLYLLSIGVNEFDNLPESQLSYAAHDAVNLEMYYKSKGLLAFDQVFSECISDFTESKPTKDNIVTGLEHLKRASGLDTVVLFLASHGLSDHTGNYYFIPKDADPGDVRKLIDSSTAGGVVRSIGNLPSLVSWQVFFDVLSAVPGKRLLIVDTCQAKNIGGTFDVYSLAKRSSNSAFALLAASREDEESQEYPPGKQGLFSYAILRGLSGQGDGNSDGRVVLSELHEFVAEFVESNRSEEIGTQTPQLVTPKELESMELAIPSSDS